MSYTDKNNTSRRSKILFLIAGILVLLLLVSAYYFFVRKSNTGDSNIGTESGEKLDLTPPTDEELRETEEFKKNLANESQGSSNPSTTPDGLRSVTPVVGYLQQAENLSVESNGYISGIAETDGICTLTLEKDNVKVTETRQAKLDAQGMICGQMIIGRDRLSQGSWKGYISYKSGKSSGISEDRIIEVK